MNDETMKLNSALIRDIKFECRCRNVQFGKVLHDLGYTPKITKKIEAGTYRIEIEDLIELMNKYAIDNTKELKTKICQVYDLESFNESSKPAEETPDKVKYEFDLKTIIDNASDDLDEISRDKTYLTAKKRGVSDDIIKVRLKLGNIFAGIGAAIGMSMGEFSLKIFRQTGYVSLLRHGHECLSYKRFVHIMEVLNVDESTSEFKTMETLVCNNLVDKARLAHDMHELKNKGALPIDRFAYIKERLDNITSYDHTIMIATLRNKQLIMNDMKHYISESNRVELHTMSTSDSVYHCLLLYTSLKMMCNAIGINIRSLSEAIYDAKEVLSKFQAGYSIGATRWLEFMRALKINISADDELFMTLSKLFINTLSHNQFNQYIKVLKYEGCDTTAMTIYRTAYETETSEIPDDETEIETIEEEETETVEDPEVEVTLSTQGVINRNDKYRFKHQIDQETAYARNRVAQIISQAALVNNMSIQDLASNIGMDLDEITKVLNGRFGITIFHAMRIEELFNFTEDLKREFEKYASQSKYSELPEYINKYIQNPTVARVLAKCAESNMPVNHFESLLKYCK